MTSTWIATLSNTSNVKWFGGLGDSGSTGARNTACIWRRTATLVLLFCGGTKKRQQVDIETALVLHEEHKARKKR